MSTIKILVLSFALSLFHSISFGQVRSSFELSPGILVDSTIRYGINANASYYMKNIPFSFGMGVGYYKNEKRSGIEFDYSYFSNTGIISNLNVNYHVIKSDKGFGLELSSRLVNLYSTHEDYASKYNFKEMKIDSKRNVDSKSNFGFGFSTIFKNRFSNGSALAFHIGVDYLTGKDARLIQTVNLGYEIPLARWNTASVFKPKTISSEKKTQKVVTENPNKEKVKEEPVPTKIEKPTVTIQPKVNKDTVVTTTEVQKSKPVNKDTTSTVKINQTKEVNNPVSNLVKKEKSETNSKPIKETKVEKKEVVEKSKVVEKKQPKKNLIEVSKPSTSDVRFKGPLNISGAQFELGDDWNYWKSDNELWFAKHKDKEKWFDLLKSLSDENYEKAKNILINNAKKVE
jgi:hypothetical protein